MEESESVAITEADKKRATAKVREWQGKLRVHTREKGLEEITLESKLIKLDSVQMYKQIMTYRMSLNFWRITRRRI